MVHLMTTSHGLELSFLTFFVGRLHGSKERGNSLASTVIILSLADLILLASFLDLLRETIIFLLNNLPDTAFPVVMFSRESS